MGLVLPQPIQAPPPGIELPFAWVRIFENRAYVSGHGPQNADGSVTELDDLDRIAGWLMVNGLIAVAPGFTNTINVMTPCSQLLPSLFMPKTGISSGYAIKKRGR